jgi:hypothetical protein
MAQWLLVSCCSQETVWTVRKACAGPQEVVHSNTYRILLCRRSCCWSHACADAHRLLYSLRPPYDHAPTQHSQTGHTG